MSACCRRCPFPVDPAAAVHGCHPACATEDDRTIRLLYEVLGATVVGEETP